MFFLFFKLDLSTQGIIMSEAFIEDAFIRFYLRNPTAYEKRFLTEQITNDPELTPRLIYISFALANEYYFY